MSFSLITAKEEIIGAAPAPPGTVPSFGHPEYSGRPIVVSNITCVVLATIVLGLRIYTRMWITRTLEYSDYSILAAWICTFAFAIVNITQCNYGLGVHIWDIPLRAFSPTFLRLEWRDNINFLKLQVATQAIYCTAMMFAKLSILLLYVRISPKPRFRAVVYGMMVVVVTYSAASVLVAIFQCIPIAKSWDITIGYGSCINRIAYFFAVLALNVATDVVMLVLPIPMLWHTRMPRRQKAGLCGIFMTGSFVCIVGILRIKSLFSLIQQSDPTWHLVEGYVWCVIELNTGIICACLPFAKPFLRHHFPLILGSTRRTGFATRSKSKSGTFPATSNETGLELNQDMGKTQSLLATSQHRSQGASYRSESQEDIMHVGADGDSIAAPDTESQEALCHDQCRHECKARPKAVDADT